MRNRNLQQVPRGGVVQRHSDNMHIKRVTAKGFSAARTGLAKFAASLLPESDSTYKHTRGNGTVSTSTDGMPV